MDTIGIEYLGGFVRYLFIILFKNEKISLQQLMDKTKYGQNLGHIKTSNHNIGVVTSFVLVGVILLINKVITIL